MVLKTFVLKMAHSLSACLREQEVEVVALSLFPRRLRPGATYLFFCLSLFLSLSLSHPLSFVDSLPLCDSLSLPPSPFFTLRVPARREQARERKGERGRDRERVRERERTCGSKKRRSSPYRCFLVGSVQVLTTSPSATYLGAT